MGLLSVIISARFSCCGPPLHLLSQNTIMFPRTIYFIVLDVGFLSDDDYINSAILKCSPDPEHPQCCLPKFTKVQYFSNAVTDSINIYFVHLCVESEHTHIY